MLFQKVPVERLFQNSRGLIILNTTCKYAQQKPGPLARAEGISNVFTHFTYIEYFELMLIFLVRGGIAQVYILDIEFASTGWC
jgi:hypothetical protein